MIELTNALKATLYERAKKPFTGTFALAWIVINWKILFTILFVDENNLNGLTKIEHIEQCYINFGDNLWYPLLWTAGLTFALPVLNLGALWIKKWFERIEFKKILKKEAIDGAQFGELLDKYELQEKDFTEKVKSLNDRITKSLATEKHSVKQKNECEKNQALMVLTLKKSTTDFNSLDKQNKITTEEFKNHVILLNDLSNYVKEYKLFVDNFIRTLDVKNKTAIGFFNSNTMGLYKKTQRKLRGYI